MAPKNVSKIYLIFTTVLVKRDQFVGVLTGHEATEINWPKPQFSKKKLLRRNGILSVWWKIEFSVD
jgi:hypothetical protein